MKNPILFDKENNKFIINHETSVAEILLLSKLIQNGIEEFSEEIVEKHPELIYERYKQIMEKLINPPVDNILLKTFHELELSVRAIRCLEAENLIYIGDLLCNHSFFYPETLPKNGWGHLLKIPNFGRKSIYEIEHAMLKRGILKFHDCAESYLDERFKLTQVKYEFLKF